MTAGDIGTRSTLIWRNFAFLADVRQVADQAVAESMAHLDTFSPPAADLETLGFGVSVPVLVL